MELSITIFSAIYNFIVILCRFSPDAWEDESSSSSSFGEGEPAEDREVVPQLFAPGIVLYIY